MEYSTELIFSQMFILEVINSIQRGLTLVNRQECLPLVQAVHQVVNSWIVHYLLIPCKETLKLAAGPSPE